MKNNNKEQQQQQQKLRIPQKSTERKLGGDGYV